MKTYDSCEFIQLADDKQFRMIFDRFYISLCVFADRYVENKDQAADIVQESFLKLWQQREEFMFLHQVKSFLYISVRNRALNEIDHQKVAGSYAASFLQKNDDGYFSDQLIEIETHRILNEAIDQLPPQSRNIMRLALEGLSNQEIAGELQISRETVHTLKKHAYRKLRILLHDYYFLFSILWM